MSSSKLIICVPKRTHRVIFAELTESAAELSEFSLPKQHSRNIIPPFKGMRSSWFPTGDLSKICPGLGWKWHTVPYTTTTHMHHDSRCFPRSTRVGGHWHTPIDCTSTTEGYWAMLQCHLAGPEGVSTKGVSTKRSDLSNSGACCAVVSKRILQ